MAIELIHKILPPNIVYKKNFIEALEKIDEAILMKNKLGLMDQGRVVLIINGIALLQQVELGTNWLIMIFKLLKRSHQPYKRENAFFNSLLVK